MGQLLIVMKEATQDLRMRHAPFHISRIEHDAWLICMKDAVNGLEIADDLKAELWEYLEAAAAAMINAAE